MRYKEERSRDGDSGDAGGVRGVGWWRSLETAYWTCILTSTTYREEEKWMERGLGVGVGVAIHADGTAYVARGTPDNPIRTPAADKMTHL